MSKEFYIYTLILIFGVSLFLGDYLKERIIEYNKLRAFNVNTEEVYANIDAVIKRHLLNLDFMLNMQNRTWLDDGEIETIASDVSVEIFNSLSDNIKKIIYRAITKDALLSYILFNITSYLVNKMGKINIKE